MSPNCSYPFPNLLFPIDFHPFQCQFSIIMYLSFGPFPNLLFLINIWNFPGNQNPIYRPVTLFPMCRFYSVSLRIGNPPKPYTLDIDSGSDLTWLQCDAPCVSCTKVINYWDVIWKRVGISRGIHSILIWTGIW